MPPLPFRIRGQTHGCFNQTLHQAMNPPITGKEFDHPGTLSIVSMMMPEDFSEIRQWCINEGWNLGISDNEIYYKIDPEGHYKTKGAM